MHKHSRSRILLVAVGGAAATPRARSVGAGLAGPSASPPGNTAQPTVSGTARDGSTLTADKGTWTGTEPISYAYRWQRCNSSGGACADVSGASNQQYTLTASDVGSTVRVVVTASNADGSSVAASEPTATVSPAGTAPANAALPSLSGTAKEGETMTASQGRWSGTTPISFAFQWERCDQAGETCSTIGGATSQTYNLAAADVGRRVRARVTATNSQGSTAASSAPSGVVAAGAAGGAIAVGDVALPNRLIVAKVTFEPNVLRSRGAFTGRVLVTDSSGHVVRGALVFVRGIPERRVEPEPEVRTDDNGVATFTFQPTQLLPLQRGGRLTMFVRARKDGDRLVAGVSASRLVSLRLSSPG